MRDAKRTVRRMRTTTTPESGRKTESTTSRAHEPTGKEVDGNPSMLAALRALYLEISPRRRKALILLLLLMLVGSVAELATLGALLPFLAVLTNPEGSELVTRAKPVLEFFGATSPTSMIYLLTGLFALAALLSAGLRLVLLRVSATFANGTVYELAVKLYDKVLHEPYDYHIRRNSSEIIAAINKVERLSSALLLPLLSGAVALVMAAFLITGLIVIDAGVALAAGIGFSLVYLFATGITRNRLRYNSRISAAAQVQRVKAMQEGLGGIRDVLINQSQPVFLETYERAMAGLRDARTKNVFYEGAPRFIVEGMGMVLIAVVAVVMTNRPGGLVEAIPILGVLALGAQRLLPMIQLIYSGWASSMGSQQLLFDVVALLRRPNPDEATNGNVRALPFENGIRLEDLRFAYAEGLPPAIEGVSLTIPKGSRVGIAGKTGSGKSTLVDLVLGLLQPTAGKIRVDGLVLDKENLAAWQKNIAHVPQAIFLADASIAENIAFGVRLEEIDRERVRSAAEQAELSEVIERMPRGFETHVGERGVQLSGGQRQRIGIARALYKQATVLVFDEATSALDSETESAVMAAIDGLDRDLTILIIAHRLSTLTGCDMVIRLESGRMVKIDHIHEGAP